MNPGDIANELQKYRNAKTTDYYDRRRALTNLSLYAPTSDWEVWPSHLAEDLRNMDLPPNHYNFIQMYVDGAAGNFVVNKVDPQFIDRSDDSIDFSETLDYLKEIYYSDKNFMNYKASHREAILNGCIYRGVEEIKTVRTPQEPMGRVGFESLSPTAVIFDTYNLTDNVAKGSNEAWKRFYLTPSQMVKYFPQMEDGIKQRLESMKHHEEGNFSQDTTVKFPESSNWGSKYEVVEHYYKKDTTIKKAVDTKTGTILPGTGFDFGSQEDYISKLNWAKTNGISLHPENITTISIPHEELWVRTFCYDMALQLEERPDERQLESETGGVRLPFFTWSYITKSGKSIGLADLGKVMQDDLNKREANKTKVMTKTPFNGKPWVHPLAFGEDEDNKKKFVDEYNDPTKPFVFDSDAPPNMNLFGIAQPANINPAIFQDETFKMGLMDRILRLPPAMQGMPGKSAESGILHSRKVIEGNIMQKMPSESLEDYQKEKFKAWLQMAVKLYGGNSKDEKVANYNRTFHKKTGEKIVVNKFKGFDEDGEHIVENSLSELRAVDVIISQSKDNDYMKQQRREVDIAYLQAMQPSPTNMGQRAVIEADLAKNLDGVTPEELEQIKEMANLSIEIAKKQMLAKSAELDTQIQQLQQMAQQPMPGAGGNIPQGQQLAPNQAGQQPMPGNQRPQR